MRTDTILEIGIDELERLYIKPATEKFTLVYRTATEVSWDNNGYFLFSPKPRRWSYLDWYKHIVDVTKNECGCVLQITEKTIWKNITQELKIDICK